MKKLILAILFLTPALAFAAPTQIFQRSILPEVTNKYDLGTTTNIWNRGFIRFASTTAASATTFCLTGDTCISTWPTGGGGGGTGLATTSPISSSNLLVYSVSGAGAAYGTATSSVTYSSPFTTSGTAGYIVGGSGFTLGLDTTGAWAGNAGTATALAADPADCSAGSFPLGINAAGAAQSCTDAWTEAENTSAAYLSNIVEDLTPQLGGDLDAVAHNITDLGDVTFKTGAAGGTMRTGTSAADKFQLEAYDVNGGAYTTVIEVDAGNDPSMSFPYLTSNGFLKTSGGNGTLSIDTNSYLSSYDAWTHPSAGVSATTSGMIFSASSTIGNGTQAGGLTISGGATTTGDVLFGNSTTGLFWDSTNGRLAIGANDFTHTISGVAYTEKISAHIEGATDGAGVSLHRHSDTAGFGSHLLLSRSRGTEASETAVVNGDVLGRLDFIGHDGTDYEVGAEIHAIADGVIGSNDLPTRLSLWTTPDGSATPLERMRITNSGNVGIGSSTPGSLLSIGGDATGINFVDGTAATSTFSGNVKIKGNLQVDGKFFAPVTLVTSGNTTINGALTVTGATTLATSLTGVGVLTSGVVSAVGAQTCTNQFVRSMSAAYVATCASVADADITGQIGVAHGGTGVATFTSGQLLYGNGTNTLSSVATTSLAVGTSLLSSGTLGAQVGGTATTFSLNMANANTWTALQTFAAASSTNFSIATWLGIPVSADPTVGTTGTLAINTTAASSSLRYYDGVAERAIYPDGMAGLPFASSTLAYSGAYGAAGTTTMRLIRTSKPLTLTGFYCDTDAGTAYVEFGNGTASTTGKCTTGGTLTTPASNNTWTMGQAVFIGIGSNASAPNIITASPTFRKDAN